jgi:hypothetical protein
MALRVSGPYTPPIPHLQAAVASPELTHSPSCSRWPMACTICKTSPSVRATAPPASPMRSKVNPDALLLLSSPYRPLSTATWELTRCRTPGGRAFSRPSPSRQPTPARALSPPTTPPSLWSTGAVPTPSLVPIPLATLAARCRQSASAEPWQSTDRLPVKRGTRAPTSSHFHHSPLHPS